MTIAIRIAHRLTAGFALDIDLALPTHGVTAIFGRSGAGKSTLLSAVAGFLSPEDGRISIDGTTLFDRAAGTDLAPHRRRVAVVFQDARLFPHLSVRRNLDYARRHGPARPAIGRFDAVVDLLGLEALLERKPRTLSGGEAQRVALGRGCWRSPGFCCSTSRLPPSTAHARTRSCPSSTGWRARGRFPCSMSAMRSTRSCGWPAIWC